MKLTLTREQIPLARKRCARFGWRPSAHTCTRCREARGNTGYDEWAHGGASEKIEPALVGSPEAITEAEHPMQVITLAKRGDADERAFWREAFTLDYAQPSSWCR